MTVKLEVHPVYVLVDYAWSVLKANFSEKWDEDYYDGTIPITPLSEAPDLSDDSPPHIIYGFADDSSNRNNASATGSTTFQVYDKNYRDLTKTINILKSVFELHDESARNVNHFSSSMSHFIGVRFGTISVSFVDSGTPEDSEGGNQSASINIRYEYVIDYGNNINFLGPST